jgi:GT2 family glycosyltransferase
MNSHTPYFSVVAAAHFRPEKLRDLINSLNIQSIDPAYFEIIIIPSPNDPAFNIKIELIKSSKAELFIQDIPNDPHQGRGVSQKRNYGALLARGTWLAFIDDDCVADKDWLKNTFDYIKNSQSDLVAIEGNTKIPPVITTTFTSKTLLHLSKPGGFQTCNIFYRKDIFKKLNGFSEEFPWFLEDTEIAWNFIHHGYKIPWSKKSVAYHPVGKNENMSRLMHEAKNSHLKLLLFKRYPDVYRKYGMSIMRRTHWVYIPIWFLILFGLLTLNQNILVFAISSLISLSITHVLYWMKGCTNPWRDYFFMAYYNSVTPVVILFVNIKKIKSYKISFADFFIILTR